MFDSLKAKLKGIFKKGSTLDEESVYKKEEAKQEPDNGEGDGGS